MKNVLSKTLILVLCALATYAQIQTQRGRIQAPVLPSISSCPAGTCCSDKTISVSGSAVVQGIPDIATINAQITVSGDTVAQAIEGLSSRVTQIISRLVANGLKESNYEARSVNVYPNISYNDGVQTILGQIAEQTIAITIPQLNNGTNIGRLYDSLAQINGISINNLVFDIKDKTSYLETARQRAFRQAQKKAEDYAGFLSLNIGRVLSVIDSYNSAPVVERFQQNKLAFARAQMSVSQQTNVNIGNIKISYGLNAVYSYL